MLNREASLACNHCQRSVIETRPAVNCDDCFTKFLMLYGTVRHYGYDPTTIITLDYDHVEGETITLDLLSPTGAYEERHHEL